MAPRRDSPAKAPTRKRPKRQAGKVSLSSGKAAAPPHENIPAIRRFLRNFRWDAVEVEPYKISSHRGGEFSGASRQVIIGKNGEPVKFHLRYFELAPGGYTSLEKHHHCHVVIAARGRGRVRISDEEYQVGPLDIIYIGPDQPHQLSATTRGRFGFFCIVDAQRDRPRPV